MQSCGDILNTSEVFLLWVDDSVHHCCLQNVAFGSALAVVPYCTFTYQSSQLYYQLLGNIHALNTPVFSFCNIAFFQIQ